MVRSYIWGKYDTETNREGLHHNAQMLRLIGAFVVLVYYKTPFLLPGPCYKFKRLACEVKFLADDKVKYFLIFL